MRAIAVVGARPQFVKLAPVHKAFAAAGSRLQVIHTGQHYDDAMSGSFFTALALPAPDWNLAVGSGPHGQQTGRMLEAIEKVLLVERPDALVVFGDTNSTLAGALAAAKLGIPVAHVEAGLRSDNRLMPEELNRIATDHLSDLLLAPTDLAMRRLQQEGLGAKAIWVGDVMADALLDSVQQLPPVAESLRKYSLHSERYCLITLHRAENTSAAVLAQFCAAVSGIAAEFANVVWPLHPRTKAALDSQAVPWAPPSNLHLLPPVPYLDMLSLVRSAAVVVTDSGGLQKECFLLGTPCVTPRTETEWQETVECGANVLAGMDPASLSAAVSRQRAAAGRRDFFRQTALQLYGTGQAARRVSLALHERWSG